jgi:hypothetical protein
MQGWKDWPGSRWACRGALTAGWLALATATMADPIRIGVIGLDTSHAEQFTMRLNDPAHPNHVPGGRVVMACPAASEDLPESAERVGEFTATLRDKYGVRIVEDMTELCAAVDAVMILSLDGRPHLEQARTAITARKPFFLDKPVAASLAEAVEIYRMADEADVPILSASALRWYAGVTELAAAFPLPPDGAISWGPAPALPHHPDLFFYAIHATEGLFTVMGPGCLTVSRVTSPAVSVVTGTWLGDRTGTLHALHYLPMHSKAYKIVRFDGEQVTEQKSLGDYGPMLREIVKFFESKQPPVSAAQTLEIYAFMQAAEESRQRGGASVTLREVLEQAGAPEKWLPPLPPPPGGQSTVEESAESGGQ